MRTRRPRGVGSVLLVGSISVWSRSTGNSDHPHAARPSSIFTGVPSGIKGDPLASAPGGRTGAEARVTSPCWTGPSRAVWRTMLAVRRSCLGRCEGRNNTPRSTRPSGSTTLHRIRSRCQRLDGSADVAARRASSVRLMRPSLSESGWLPGWREERGECCGELLGVGQRDGVPGAGELLRPSIRDVGGHVPRGDPLVCLGL